MRGCNQDIVLAGCAPTRALLSSYKSKGEREGGTLAALASALGITDTSAASLL